MADITLQSVINFSNDGLRPAAEKLDQALDFCRLVLADWPNHSANVPNSALDNLVDGRAAEGITQLTGADIHDFIDGLTRVLEAYDGDAAVAAAPTRKAELRKPRVRIFN